MIKASIRVSPVYEALPMALRNPCSLYQFPAISREALLELLIRVKSGSPADSCPPYILREVFTVNPDPALFLLNDSLIQGCVPRAIKKAIIVPLFF